jgi:hypothetical protein
MRSRNLLVAMFSLVQRLCGFFYLLIVEGIIGHAIVFVLALCGIMLVVGLSFLSFYIYGPWIISFLSFFYPVSFYE